MLNAKKATAAASSGPDGGGHVLRSPGFKGHTSASSHDKKPEATVSHTAARGEERGSECLCVLLRWGGLCASVLSCSPLLPHWTLVATHPKTPSPHLKPPTPRCLALPSP